MQKDFDRWNGIKKQIENKKLNFLEIKEKEIWWCNLGLNIGDEENGKHPNLERPVLIIKNFNNRVCLTIPLTTKSGNVNFYHRIFYKNTSGYVILSQIRLLSVKRLRRKISILSKHQFYIVKDRIHDMFN